MSRNILIGFLASIALSAPVLAEPAPTPESQLLLPFFETSLGGLERMTFFSIVNASDEPLDLTATVYSNWAVPMLEVPIDLQGKEVRTINLHDWIVAGKMFNNETICPGGEADCLDLFHLQDALAGQPSSMTQLYYGNELEEGVATGFITIKADNGFLPESDVLWGDYFYTDPLENFAQGQRLVRLEPDLSCADLCFRHSIRFLEGGGFNGGTLLTIWSWDGIEREPSEFPTPQFDLGETHIDAYNQKGELVDVIPNVEVLPVQTIEVSELNIRQPFGWLDLTTNTHSSISGFYRALGKFSVGVPSWCLPCDPCNANGPCYEPGNPGCAAPVCIPPHIRITGDRAGELGKFFRLEYEVSGSTPIEVLVSDLPAGLAHRGNVIEGIPAEEGSFSISATNDCGGQELTVVIGPPMPEAYLTLVKEVVNDHGGTATVSSFPLFIDGQRVSSGERVKLDPGSYRASEQNLPGYSASAWSGDCAPNGTVTLAADDDKVCVITNNDDPARLTLVKQVINDNGGTATVADFALFVDSQRVTSGQANVFAPGTYRASEQNLPGYSAGIWTGDCAADGTVTLALGDNKTCVITNDDNAPITGTLTLIKRVINDDGGTAAVADFDLFIDDQQVASGQTVTVEPGTYRASERNLPGYRAGPWSGDCAADGTVTVGEEQHKTCIITNDDEPKKAYLTLIKRVVNDDGGTARVSDFALYANGQLMTSGTRTMVAPGTYTASEQNLPGYEAGSWTGDCTADGRVTLADNDDKVCEIVNDDKPARITLIKHVVNDDGGTARVSDFALYVGDQSVTSGVAKAMAPGTYTARENNLPGYEAGAWGGDCAANGSVSLALGEHKVCEIVNDDKPARITLIKHVINDDGGTARVSDFALSVSGQQVTSGVAKEIAPGTYTASESNLPGYEAGPWGGDCAANGSVTLTLGEHKVCEITNDDKPARITLIKHVVNDDGGTARVSDFALYVGDQQVTSGVAKEMAPGTYTASEQNLPDYEASAWRGDCSADGRVTLALGEHKVCEITNDDKTPPCDPAPTFDIWNGSVDANYPHNGYHHTEVSFNFRVDGEVHGEVQIFWQNGGSTYIKKRKSISIDCEDPAKEGSLFWESDSRSHHPGHGAKYSARLVINGSVVASIPLN